MSLSTSQKKLILKKYRKTPLDRLSKSIGKQEEEVISFLKSKGLSIRITKRSKKLESKPFEKFFKRKDLIIFCLVFVCFLVFFNSLWGEFVSDDLAFLKKPEVASPWAFLSKGGNITAASVSVNYLIDKVNSFNYHLTSLLIHSAVVILLFFTLRKITKNIFLSFLASLLFAVHPLHSEAVSWISGRPYPFGAFFLLISFLFYLKAEEKNSWWLFFAALGFYFLGFLTEIKSIAFFLIIFAFEFSLGSLKKNWKRVLGFSLLALAMFGLQFTAFKTRVTTENPEYTGGVELLSPFVQVPTAISNYLELFVFPKGLTLYHENFAMTNFQFGLKVFVFLLFLGLLLFSYLKKEKLLFFSLSLFFLSLTPTLLPIRIAWLVAERYVYFASIGLCLALALLLLKLYKNNKKIAWGLFLVFFLGLSTRTIIRNLDWRTRESLWTSAVKVDPLSSKAWNNMGDIYAGKKEYEKALEAFQKAIDIRPSYVDAHHNKGVTYMRMGEYDKAIEKFNDALAIFPLTETLNTLGVAYFEKGDYKKAEEYFSRILEREPNNATAYNSLGIVKMTLGENEKAKEYFLKALEIDPNSQAPKDNLSLLESKKP